MKPLVILMLGLATSASALELVPEGIEPGKPYNDFRQSICQNAERVEATMAFDQAAQSTEVCETNPEWRTKPVTLVKQASYQFDQQQVILYQLDWAPSRASVKEWVLYANDRFIKFERETGNIQRQTIGEVSKIGFDHRSKQLTMIMDWREFYPPAPDRFYHWNTYGYVFDLDAMEVKVYRAPLEYKKTRLNGELLSPIYRIAMNQLNTHQWQFSAQSEELWGRQPKWLGVWPAADGDKTPSQQGAGG